jgi:hypothetical protein
MVNQKDEYMDNLRYVACRIRAEFSEIGYSDETITDMLVEYLYGKGKRYKQLLWFCYGQHVVNNIEKNIGVRRTRAIQCIDCGEWIEVDNYSKTCRCNACQHEHKKELDRQRKRRK